MTGIGGETSVFTQAIARNRLRSMGVTASAGIDALRDRPRHWPGAITLSLDYDGLDPITLVFPGRDPYRVDEPSDGKKLLDALRADLT